MVSEKKEITPETAELIEASVKRAQDEFEGKDAPADLSAPRTKKGGAGLATSGIAVKSGVRSPELDPDVLGPASFAAVAQLPITGNSESQVFIIDADKMKYLHFTEPGLNLPKKRLYTVKAFSPSGTLVQLPFEPQIQNSAGGDPMDAIGLHRYARKGFKLLFNFETMQPVYCAAWGCWAQADGRTGFCTTRHAAHTLPNRFKDAGEIVQGLMSQGVTTSRIWGS